MFSKYSVKKPLSIFVAAVMVIVLGVVSFMNMSTDLLPEMEFPYIVAVTTYPGATPEKVETNVTKVLEQTFSTANGIETVQSVSSENVSMIVLQFSQGTNMDSTMVDLNSKLTSASALLPDNVSGTQMVQINPDLLPVVIASIDMDGKDLKEISKIATDEIIPELERINGVASVTASGVTEDKIKIEIDKDKIESINDKIIASIDSTIASREKTLKDAESTYNTAKSQFDAQKASQEKELSEKEAELQKTKQSLTATVAALQAVNGSDANVAEYTLEAMIAQTNADIKAAGAATAELSAKLAAQQSVLAIVKSSGMSAIPATLSKTQEGLSSVDDGLAQIASGKSTMELEFYKAEQQLASSKAQIDSGKEALETAKTEAFSKAGLSGQLTASTISQMLSAQNFSMPAGSVVGENDTEISVKVGNELTSIEELSSLVIADIDNEDIGKITLEDIAAISMVDNADDSYTIVNGNRGILVTFQKQSNAATNEVSTAISDKFDALQKEYDGLHITTFEDQGVYINIVVGTVIQNLLMGAILAILILLLFLRSFKATFTVAVSIPLSVIFAIVLMYFSGVTLNIISLAGLALGVGMLVDNSIVVIENIYRLRAEGASVKEAAIKGAGQVAGAITASTLTTVCVFAPIIFTEGITRQLFVDMGLTIAYSLLASLIVALTLVPALASSLKISHKEKKDTGKETIYDKIQKIYGKMLAWALRFKPVVLGGAVALLAISIIGAGVMGKAFIPESDSEQISVTVEAPIGSNTVETRAIADEMTELVEKIEGVESVGTMQGGSGMMQSGGDREISIYVVLEKNRKNTSLEICNLIEKETEGKEYTVSAASTMGDMTSIMSGSGVSVQITGTDSEKLATIAEDIGKMVESIDGTLNVDNGLADSTPALNISVDKSAAMKHGLTVAQVYQYISTAISSGTTATTLTETENSASYDIVVSDGAKMTKEELEDYTFTVNDTEIKLSDIATVEDTQSLAAINRENQVRYITVSSEIDAEHNIANISSQLQDKIDAYDIPEGYEVSIVGENETINESFSQLGLMILLAIALIYGIMIIQFQSLISPFIVMFTIPLAFTGGLLALWIFGFDLSVISILGFLVLSGIIVNNGIVFIDYTNTLVKEGMAKRDALILAGKTRLRPIMMTAITTILGLSTLSLGIGTGADMLQPMAVVVIGGLIYATLLTLFIVPVLYDIVYRKRKNKKADEEALAEE